MKAPLKFSSTLQDADGHVIASSTIEHLSQADAVQLQEVLSSALIAAAKAKLAEHK